jgi:hypothetical protein
MAASKAAVSTLVIGMFLTGCANSLLYVVFRATRPTRSREPVVGG